MADGKACLQLMYIESGVRSHPELQGLRRWMLATADAQGRYAQFGFQPLAQPERLMEIVDREIYLSRPP